MHIAPVQQQNINIAPMNQLQKRLILQDIYDHNASEVNNQFRPLIQQAIASSDYDRLILLEAQREFKLNQLLKAWIKVDASIQKHSC